MPNRSGRCSSGRSRTRWASMRMRSRRISGSSKGRLPAPFGRDSLGGNVCDTARRARRNPPMRELLRRLDDALSAGGERIVCQVVETKGSTPQKAGALMVVDPDGGQLGTLGGGCVENEVKM